MDLTDYLRFLAALTFVLALIGGLAWLLRRTGWGGKVVTSRHGRLGVVEVAPVDAKRRLVLLRRDGVEHLVLLSPTSETVIEAGIAPPAGLGKAPAARAESEVA